MEVDRLLSLFLSSRHSFAGMTEGPKPWDLLLRHVQSVIASVIAGLILLTATLLVGTIGLTTLGFIWAGVLLTLALIYALKWRGEVTRTKKDIDALREQLSDAEKVEVPEPEDAPIPPPLPENVPEGLEHVATVTLDTEVTPPDSYWEPFDKGEVVEVEAESTDGETFHFFMCDEEDFLVNRYRSVNFKYLDGKLWTQRFKKRIVIPYSDVWYFFAYTPEGEDYATVQLKISRVR